jgi:hypothetical protein
MDMPIHPGALIFFDSWNDLNFIYECSSPHVKPYILKHLHVKMMGLLHEEAVEEVVNQCNYHFVMFTLYRRDG